jgi:lysophospholipase L1-like esterase
MYTLRHALLIPALLAALACPTTCPGRQAIEDPGALRTFFTALDRTRLGVSPVRILHYGDSHTAADLLTGSLRSRFAERFGEAGIGFVYAGKPWSWYARRGVENGASDGWRVDGLRVGGDGRFGLSGLSLSTSLQDECVWMTATFSRADVYLLAQPGGGVVDILLDNQIYRANVRLSAPTPTPVYVDVMSEQSGMHTLEVLTRASGTVRVLGFTATTKDSGVEYDTLGINGARAYRPLDWDWSLLESNLARRGADLVVLAYGTNEATDPDFDPSAYERRFEEVLRRFRKAAPKASILVLGPPDLGTRIAGRWRTAARLTSLIEAQRRAARREGAAFWDTFAAMGGAGSIDEWAAREVPLARRDRVHLTTDGYRLVASLLFDEITRNYRDFQGTSHAS